MSSDQNIDAEIEEIFESPGSRISESPGSRISVSPGSSDDTFGPFLKRSSQRGYKASDLIWDHFSSHKKSEAEGVYSLCNHCDYKNKGKNHTTLKHHLESKHEDIWKQYIDRKAEHEKKQKEKKETPKLTMEHFTTRTTVAKAYSRDHHTYKQMKPKLAALGCTSFSLNLVETPEFHDLIAVFDPRGAASLPVRNTLKNWIYDAEQQMKQKITESLSERKNAVTICVDMWSQQGLTYSYLGVTAHFYDTTSKHLKAAALACSILPHPHTAARILDKLAEILSPWMFSLDDIWRFVTDGGANIVCALKDETISQIDPAVLARRADWNLDQEDPETEDLDHFESESEDYWVVTDEIEREFPRRISCYAHKMNNVCKSVIDADGSPIKDMKDEVLKAVKRFSHSGSCNEELKRLAGKGLLKPSKTRWNSFYYVINRLLLVQQEFSQVCLDNDIPLSFSWADVKMCRDLMKPFAEQTTFVEGHKYSTGSKVIPAILTLKEHLEDPTGKFQCFGNICTKLSAEIDKRFRTILDTDDPEFDPTLLICTMLDPDQSTELSPNFFDKGKEELKKFLKANGDGDDQNGDSHKTSNVRPSPVPPQGQEEGKKKRREFCSGGDTATSPLSAQIADYTFLLDNGGFTEGTDCFSFWEQNRDRFSRLYHSAVKMLAIPGTSAPVERMFSQAGLSSSGKAHNIAPQLIEAEVILKYNKNEWNTFDG